MGKKRDNRIHNIYKKTIVDLVREHNVISRTQINKLTKIRMATITNVTAELINEGYLEEVQKPNQSKFLALNRNYYALGIDIQPERLITALYNSRYETICEAIHTIDMELPPNKVIKILFTYIDKMMTEYDKNKIIGIGISVTGMIDITKSVLISSSQLHNWNNIHIKDMFSERYELPVFVEDSALLNLIGEKSCTDIGEFRDIIYVQLGYGIGTGIMSDGRIVSGHQGLAGELGHSVIIPDGKLCTCGNYGCLRTVATSTEIVSQYSEIMKMYSSDVSGIDIHTILKSAENNEKIALNVIDGIIRYIGIALANSINMLNPKMIIFGGQMFEKSNYLLEPLKNIINRYILPQFTPEIHYKAAELNLYGGTIGASVLVFDSFYDSI